MLCRICMEFWVFSLCLNFKLLYHTTLQPYICFKVIVDILAYCLFIPIVYSSRFACEVVGEPLEMCYFCRAKPRSSILLPMNFTLGSMDMAYNVLCNSFGPDKYRRIICQYFPRPLISIVMPLLPSKLPFLKRLTKLL